MAGYYGFMLDVCVSVHPSISSPSIHMSFCISFPDDNWVNINGFSPLPHVSGEVLLFHIGRPCVCPSIRLSRTSIRLAVRQYFISWW